MRHTDCVSEPICGCHQHRQERLVDERHDDLRLRIAHADVELDHLRTVRRQHQADVEEADERIAFGRHPGDRRARRSPSSRAPAAPRQKSGSAQTRPCLRCSGPGRRRRSVCDPARVPIGNARAPSHTTKNDTSGPDRHSSMTTRVAGVAESALAHRGDKRRLCVGRGLGDDDALAGGESVGLEHDRHAERARRARRQRVVERRRTYESAPSAR